MDPLLDPRNILLARKAKQYGMQNSLRIIVEAKRAGVPVSLAFAVAEQETGNGANVWGGDPAPNGGTSGLNNKQVTKERYKRYLAVRGPQGRGGMQGVGPFQLTWWEYQDGADRLGGCHIPKYNIAFALSHLAGLIKIYGMHDGVRRYNGAGKAAEAYANSVMQRQQKWHKRFA